MSRAITLWAEHCGIGPGPARGKVFPASGYQPSLCRVEKLLYGALEYSPDDVPLHEKVENDDRGDAQDKRCKEESVF